MPLPNVHTSLLPNGRVLFWGTAGQLAGGDNTDRPTPSVLYDPASGAFSEPIMPNTYLFCSGMNLLPDGRLFAAGGTLGFDAQTGQFYGARTSEIFDPATNAWTQAATMPGAGRWYPTQITLPDGRVGVFGGIDNGTFVATNLVYDPARDAWTPVATRATYMYPRAHVMPDGLVFFPAPQSSPFLFNPADGSIVDTAERQRITRLGGASVQLDAASGKILIFGGRDGGDHPFTSSSELFDPATKQWSVAANMSYGRYWVNGVLLPTGEVLALGGDTAPQGSDPLPAELYDPIQDRWTVVARPHQQYPYHGTAILLPDGRVLTTNQLQHGVELYRPWYFDGPRPTLDAAPSLVTYGESFEVRSPDAARIARVELLKVGSVTHGLNTDQRLVLLDFTATPAALRARAPAQPFLAPPGDYMLFLVDQEGRPSSARMVRLVQGETPGVPVKLTVAPGPGKGELTLTWAPPLDDGGSPITGWNLYQADGPGGAPQRVGSFAAATTTFRATGLGNGASKAYFIAAVNAHGEGFRTSVVKGIAFFAPASPREVTAILDASGVQVAWKAPAVGGGAPVRGYVVESLKSPEGARTRVAVVDGGTLSLDVPTAAAGKYYRVAAANVAGQGPFSAPVATRTVA